MAPPPASVVPPPVAPPSTGALVPGAMQRPLSQFCEQQSE
jgi:hypothetical protein